MFLRQLILLRKSIIPKYLHKVDKDLYVGDFVSILILINTSTVLGTEIEETRSILTSCETF